MLRDNQCHFNVVHTRKNDRLSLYHTSVSSDCLLASLSYSHSDLNFKVCMPLLDFKVVTRDSDAETTQS